MDPIPIVVRANPARTMSAGRRFPARLPASNATPNMLSDSGASERPASIALYSRVICKKSGSAIIAPPRVICCIIVCEIPIRKCGNRNRSGSSNVAWPSRLRLTSHQANSASALAPSAMSSTTDSPPSCQTRMPSTTPPMPMTESAAPTASIWRGPVYFTSRTSRMPDKHHADDHDLERETDPPRQIGRDEPAEQRPDRGRDRGRGTDQRVRLRAGRAFEVAVDERLHRGQQERRAETADDRPEDDDRGEALGDGHRERRRSRTRAGRARRRACGR